MSMNIAKVMIKLTNEGNEAWTHLCYVDKNLYVKYAAERKKKYHELMLNDALESWAKQTLKKSVVLLTTEDLAELKALVKTHYKKKYPELFINSGTDRQGWMRVWVTEMMEEELKNGK